MDALYKTGEIQKALSLLSEMKDYKVELDSSSYSIAICCFVEKGEIQEACSCQNKVIEMSCVPSVPAYLSLVRGLCQTEEIDAAMMLVRECLGNVESGPMEFKYALRVIHVCKESNAAKVIEVLDEMKEEGLSPSEVIFCAIIFGICKHGTLQTCKEVFAELKDRKDLAETDMVVYDEMIIEHMNKKTSDLVLSGFLWS
ncbi:Pentatricopeptide repeat-containing protein [Cardamine amara subsp. amara]|uniref:Pentatricopeptide repeat-containing protein n=1 Tax=Cardamine amara subsp. amara TaxID=228776 RepID=A0ABD1C969_CARAN